MSIDPFRVVLVIAVPALLWANDIWPFSSGYSTFYYTTCTHWQEGFTGTNFEKCTETRNLAASYRVNRYLDTVTEWNTIGTIHSGEKYSHCKIFDDKNWQCTTKEFSHGNDDVDKRMDDGELIENLNSYTKRINKFEYYRDKFTE
jgi:hypothetical protein